MPHMRADQFPSGLTLVQITEEVTLGINQQNIALIGKSTLVG